MTRSVTCENGKSKTAEQAFYALVDLYRAEQGMTPLYTMADAES